MSDPQIFSWVPIISAASGFAGAVLGAIAIYLAQLKLVAWQRKKDKHERVINERLRTLIPVRTAVTGMIEQFRDYGIATKASLLRSEDPFLELLTAQKESRRAQLQVADPTVKVLVENVQEFFRNILDSDAYVAAVATGSRKEKGQVIVDYYREYAGELEDKRVALLNHIEFLLEGRDLE